MEDETDALNYQGVRSVSIPSTASVCENTHNKSVFFHNILFRNLAQCRNYNTKFFATPHKQTKRKAYNSMEDTNAVRFRCVISKRSWDVMHVVSFVCLVSFYCI